MKHLSIIALVTLATLGFAGNVTQTLTYSPASLQLGSEQGYATVNFSGFPHTEKLGSPSLPTIPCQVVIPPTAEVTGFEVTDLREEPVAGTYNVMPVQFPQAWMENSRQFPFVKPDPAYYGVNAAYPVQAAEFADAGTKAGYRLASFLVYPVRYNPVTKQLSVVTRLTVKVTYADHKLHVPKFSDMQISIHGSELRRLVLNPEDVSRWAPPKKTQSFGSAFLPAGTYEHVILAANAYKDSLARLRDWRTRQGWRSIIVPIESVAAVYPGVDTAEKMRNFLKDAETTWSTIFCFIARKDWPAHQYRAAYANVSGYPVDYLPCDWYFECLDGSWNFDGDGYWGEPSDSVDFWPDIYSGMITLDGFTELNNYLNKLFRYEFTPDTGWFTKSLLGNDVTFSNEYNDSVANATPTPPWFDLKMYTSGGMVQPSVQGYCDSLNSGYPLTVVIAHGAVDLYGMGGNVTSPIMNALTNTNRLSMFTGVCCHTGAWDEAGNTNGDCIAENMAFHAPAGFVGVDMNTRYGWVDVAEWFNFSICYGLIGNRGKRVLTQGEALSFGKDYWHARVAIYTDTSKYRWEAYERTLFGEPAVPIWMGKAFHVAVTKPSVINIGAGIPVNIAVNSADGPVDSAMVCLVKGSETFARGFTNSSGEVTLTVSPLTPGAMQLTVSCASNFPYLDSIMVISSGKYVAYLKSWISDPPPGGNGDSLINAGESFHIPTWVKNYGTQTATGVTGRLGTATSGVTITDSIKSFGTIAGGDSAQNAEGFGMTVASGLPNGYTIRCSLMVKDASDSTWKSYPTFTVGAPVLSYEDKVVRDSGASNPNGKLDPGETADMEIILHNAGLGKGTNVAGTLRSSDTRLVFSDSLGTWAVIPPGGSLANAGDRFTVHADAGIPPETPIPCTLLVTADGGYAVTMPFTLVVGEFRKVDPVPDGPRAPELYWAFDNEDVGYAQHPTFSWVEVNGVGTRMSFAQNDDVDSINIPAAFGPVKFYNQRYTKLSISADGWIACGSYAQSNYTNTDLPSASAPPAVICGNWDDLYPETEGDGYVYYYHDTANHRFVVEFDSVAYWSAQSTRDKFEFVFYDTTMAGPDGNSQVLVQYLTANRTSSMTAGIQDPTRAIGIQCLYNDSYHKGASTIVPGHAILYTTTDPTSGVHEPDYGAALSVKALNVAPSLFSSAVRINWQLKRDGNADLKVYDAGGRVVRTLVSGPRSAGSYTTTWDGNDNAGRSLARGIYFVRLSTPDQTVKVKTILAR